MESPRPPIDTAEELLALQGVSHDYGSLEVVRGVTLAINRSEIHALVGQHGTGKTTLAMMVSGMLRPRSGTITFLGRRHASLNLQLSHRLGIRMVYQHLSLNDIFTVAETLFANDPRVNNFAWNSPRRVNKAAAEYLAGNGFDIEPTARLRSLSLSDRAVVDILKQLLARPSLLVLDEALEKLTPPALSRIVPVLLQRAREGMAILFITHRIDDVYSFAHRVSIMREGQLIFTGPTEDIDQMNLVRLAYTQFSDQPPATPAKAEFTRFLRYNEAILAHLPLSLAVTDTAVRVKLVNGHFQDAFGLSAGECMDRPLAELLPGVAGAEADQLDGALRRGEEREFFNMAVRAGKRSTLHNLRTLPVLDGGQHIGSILLMEDITEYDRMQKKVMLTEKLASVGLLAAGVAHEINNPLEIISNYLTALRKRVHTPDAQETVSLLGEEISYISAIVSNLVNLADTNRLAREEIDLNDVASRILGLLRESAKSRRIRIEFRPGRPEVRVMANANEVKQVILNLMKNGFEAMPDGGTVTVSTDEGVVDGVATAFVRVEDEGPGISAANLTDVFLPFYTTKKSGGENMGLGLSVSYAILERYGGRLSAENLPGRGCRFTIALPQAARDAPTTEKTAPPKRG